VAVVKEQLRPSMGRRGELAYDALVEGGHLLPRVRSPAWGLSGSRAAQSASTWALSLVRVLPVATTKLISRRGIGAGAQHHSWRGVRASQWDRSTVDKHADGRPMPRRPPARWIWPVRTAPTCATSFHPARTRFPHPRPRSLRAMTECEVGWRACQTGPTPPPGLPVLFAARCATAGAIQTVPHVRAVAGFPPVSYFRTG
jgi:hypothetical protein